MAKKNLKELRKTMLQWHIDHATQNKVIVLTPQLIEAYKNYKLAVLLEDIEENITEGEENEPQ